MKTMTTKRESELKKKNEAAKALILKGNDPDRYKKYKLVWAVGTMLQATKLMQGDTTPLTIEDIQKAVEGSTVKQIKDSIACLRESF